MVVTVGICTWNRAELLDQTLKQMRKLRVPNGVEWELLIVNNNCTDHTDEVIARHKDALPIRRLFEPQPGHSNARNCAIDHAQGELLLWTDDDVLVDPNWLSAYVDAGKIWPDATFFGGPVSPWFEVSPPAWIARHIAKVEGAFAIRQLGESSRLFERDELPFGANMAFRTESQKMYRYDPVLGRVGNGMVSGDETFVIDRMRQDGLTGAWIGEAKVDHFIPKERLSREYLQSYFVGSGQTHVLIKGAPELPELFGVPRSWLKEYLTCAVKSWLLSPWQNDDWLTAFRKAATVKGMIQQYRKQRCQTR